MNHRQPDIALISDDAASNSLGRAFCLWQLARAAGLGVAVLATRGSRLWSPIQGTEFAKSVHILSGDEAARPWESWSPHLLLPVKPVPASAGLALEWSRLRNIPLILDIDDPDIEAALAVDRPMRALAKSVLKPRQMAFYRRMRVEAPGLPTIVSNPFLQQRYGGVVIPHVREDRGLGRPQSRPPTIAFVGTIRGHKGIDRLRDAVTAVQDIGYRLTVTEAAPDDAKPWENWVGGTSFEDGMNLVASSDVVVIPSDKTVYSEGQLPAKLVDAMMLGRAVVASDLPAQAWALGDAGVLFPAGDAAALAARLRELVDPEVRSRMGSAAAERAREMFTVNANVGKFADLYESVLRSRA